MSNVAINTTSETDFREAFSIVERLGNRVRATTVRGTSPRQEFGRIAGSLVKLALLCGHADMARQFLEKQPTSGRSRF